MKLRHHAPAVRLSTVIERNVILELESTSWDQTP